MESMSGLQTSSEGPQMFTALISLRLVLAKEGKKLGPEEKLKGKNELPACGTGLEAEFLVE